MKLEIPLLFDKKYVEFINENQSIIQSLYFSYIDNTFSDARCHCQSKNILFEETLKSIENIDKLLLINGMSTSIKVYSDKKNLKLSYDKLIKMYNEDIITGLVVYDLYYIKALNTLSAEKIPKGLKIVPSVNFNISSISRLNSVVTQFSDLLDYDYIPSIIHIDRSLNRNIKELDKLVEYIREKYPTSLISLLVNEGCIYNCVYKNTHDALISNCNISYYEKEVTDHLSNLDCNSLFNKEPWKLLTTPFIRPEDLKYYINKYDVIKIAGRTLPTPELINIIHSYINQEYEWNIFNLSEVHYGFKDKYILDNELIPKDFYHVTTSCDKLCNECNYCKDLFNEKVQKRRG